MKHNKFICAVTALALTLGICGSVMPFSPTAHAAGNTVRLDPSEASPFNDGKFEGWGTSMGWWGNRIGYSDKMSQQAAHDLYSEEGLGLDIVRYNVGGGDNPTHNHINRSDSKLPCFAVPQYEGGTYQAEEGVNKDVTNLKKDANGDVVYTWDWDADKNQVNVLTKIKEQNPNVHIEGYTNSPPWFMTNSQCSSGGDDIPENLDPSNYDVFADFLVEVTKHMEEIGLPFDSYSPMNEPNPKSNYWRALSNKQEGNLVAQGANQSGLIKALKDAYTAAGIDTLVAGPDETDLGYTVSSVNALTAEGKAALDRIDTHTYGGSDRAGVKAVAQAAGKNLWMSEVDGNWDGFGLANQIITDLNGMQASAWVMWDIIDSHKDSDFVDLTTGNKTEAERTLSVTGSMWGVGMGNHDTEEVEWANKYYAYGQFTRYINPGDTLIASSNSTLAAYNRETGDIKIVVNNSGSSDIPYTFDLSAFTTVGDTVKEIRSNNLTGDAAEHWATIENEATLNGKTLTTTAKAGTITTYVISGAEGFDDKYAIITGGGSEINVNASVQLTLKTNIEGSVTWKVDDDKVASITDGGLLTANKSGTVTVSATVGDYTATRVFVVPAYKLSGTPSWGDASNAPADSADYRKAADKDLTTYFDGTQNGYVMYDYGTPYKINKVQLAPRDGYAARTVGGKVQGSNDAITWTDLYTVAEALTEGQYTDVTEFANTNAYRYYRYTNPTTMTNIAEFLIEGDYPTGITMYSATEKGLAYSYKLPEEYSGCDAYFAVHDGNRLKYASANQTSGSASGNFSNLAPKLYVWDSMEPKEIITDTSKAVADEPIVSDINGFTDNFEGSENIFGGKPGGLEDGKIVYASGLERFGNVFIPANTTASATLASPITLGKNQLFRLQFNMFAGWEDKGKDNTFALKDADGNEIVALYLTGGGYNLNQLRIGGENVLTGTPVSQSRSNPGSSKAGANGWDGGGQAYRNNMGYNKTCEILIDGAGNVSVSLTGGMADTTATGTLTSPVSIKSMETTGECNSSRGRIVSYDNFDADVITYKDDFKDPTVEPTPEPTDPPVLPADNTLISLDFNDGDLKSGSPYGKAEAVGTAKFATDGDKKVLQLDNTNTTAIKLTDANGNGLLAGQDEITVSFKVKPTTDATSWWFYSAPNDNAQTYQQEHYLGAMSNTALHIERYNNSGSRSTANDGTIKVNDWNDVIISFAEGKTDLYINGALASSVASSAKLSDILGSNPVAYIGKANWVNGEFATGYIDDFKIVKGALKSALNDIDLGDLSAVKSNLTLPTEGGITWTSSNEAVISTEGVVTRPDQTTTVKLTASVTENGVAFTRTFDVVVVGTESSAYLFTHFVGNESSADHEQIYFSVSQTGTSWTTLNGGKPVLTSNVGEKGVRDPYILRGKDGKFYIIATDLSIYHNNDWGRAQSAGSQSIVVWESSDLVNWGDARLVKVAVDNAGCTWAPEAVYDKAKGKYMVFWASRVLDDNYAKQRVYRSYTSDFKEFTTPEVYIESDADNIDTTIVEENDMYYRFTKDESKKSVTMMKSTSLDSGWTDVATYTINGVAGNTVTGYEGPTIYKNNDGGWTLLLDYYSKSQGYKPFVTDDLSKGVFKSAADFTFDATYRHGTVMPITQDEYDALIAKYRNS